LNATKKAGKRKRTKIFLPNPLQSTKTEERFTDVSEGKKGRNQEKRKRRGGTGGNRLVVVQRYGVRGPSKAVPRSVCEGVKGERRKKKEGGAGGTRLLSLVMLNYDPFPEKKFREEKEGGGKKEKEGKEN